MRSVVLLLFCLLVPGLSSIARAIIGGSVEAGHGYVGTLIGSSSFCSGVLVATSGGSGWVLTAAHCLPVLEFRIGEDLSSPDSVHPVVESVVHPAYAGSSENNFALVRVTGLSAGAAVLAPATGGEDTLVVGSQVTIVGYGVTDGGPTTLRHSASVDLSEITAALLTSTSATVNVCSGDSGGGAIAQLAAGPRLVGTASAGDCSTFSLYGRVSAVYDDFIAPTLGGLETPIFADGFESGSTSFWSISVP